MALLRRLRPLSTFFAFLTFVRFCRLLMCVFASGVVGATRAAYTCPTEVRTRTIGVDSYSRGLPSVLPGS